MTSVTLNGNTYSDDTDANTGLAGGGHRKRWVPCLVDAMVEIAAAKNAQTVATAKADIASAGATAAAASATTATGAAAAAASAAAVATALASGSATARAALRPTLLLDFANGKFLDPRAVFARATTARRTNEQGLAETVLAGVPRITHDPWYLSCSGLRIEKASTNLLLRSSDFANWSFSGLAITPAAAQSPDGTVTASKLVLSAGSFQYGISRAVTGMTAGGAVATTIEAKAGELSIIQIYWFGGTSGVSTQYANFDLISGQTAGNADLIAARRLQGGWWRLSAGSHALGTLTAGTDTGIAICNSLGNGRRPTSAGDGTSGLYLAQAQTEDGADPTAIIPTTTAQVTRAAETCSIGASPWLRQGEGTMAVEFVRSYPVPPNGTPRVLTLHDGTANNRLSLQLSRSGANTQLAASIVSAGVSVDTAAVTITPDTTVRAMLAWKAGDAALYVNGVEVWTGTTAAIPTGLTTLSLGTDSTGANQLNGTLSRVAYYPTRLAAANCIAMTA